MFCPRKNRNKIEPEVKAVGKVEKHENFRLSEFLVKLDSEKFIANRPRKRFPRRKNELVGKIFSPRSESKIFVFFSIEKIGKSSAAFFPSLFFFFCFSARWSRFRSFSLLEERRKFSPRRKIVSTILEILQKNNFENFSFLLFRSEKKNEDFIAAKFDFFLLLTKNVSHQTIWSMLNCVRREDFVQLLTEEKWAKFQQKISIGKSRRTSRGWKLFDGWVLSVYWRQRKCNNSERHLNKEKFLHDQ